MLVVIYTAALEVLLLERADHPGMWQSVTGSQDGRESVRDTAMREVREETGLEAAQYGLTDWQIQNVYEIYDKWRHRYPPGTLYNTGRWQAHATKGAALVTKKDKIPGKKTSHPPAAKTSPARSLPAGAHAECG